MAVSYVGAIYATKSLLLQRVYIPGSHDAEIKLQHVGAGESIVWVPLSVYQKGGEAAVQARIGTPTHNGICAVIHKDTGKHIDTIIADPDIFRHPDGHKLSLLG